MQSSSSHLACESSHPLPVPPPLPPPSQAADDDLELLAEHLAREFGFDAKAAELASPAWYRERIGSDICTLGRATGLRLLTMQHCQNKATRYPFLVTPYRDVFRDDVRDAHANRSRRGLLIGGLPYRVNAGVVEMVDDVDPEFDQRRMRAEFERRMSEEAAAEEEHTMLSPRGVLAFLVLLAAASCCFLWAVKRAVIR